MIIVWGWLSQSDTITAASVRDRGSGKARGFVAIRTKARITGQHNATGSGPDKALSSQSFAPAWCSDDALYAYNKRFASTRIIDVKGLRYVPAVRRYCRNSNRDMFPGLWREL